MLQVGVALPNQAGQIPAKQCSLHDPTKRAKRRSKGDVVEHLGSVGGGPEAVLVSEDLERPPELLVDEPAGLFELGDLTGHRPPDAEVASPPRDTLPQADRSRRDPANGALS